jgi:hypothetical protein
MSSRLGSLFLLGALGLSACAGDPALGYGYGGILDGLQPVLEAMRAVFVLAGLALLLAGWKIYRLVVALPGLLIGAVLGAALGYGAAENWLLAFLGVVLGGLLGAGLALLFHDVAVFVIGAIIGAAITAGLLLAISDSPPALLIIIGGLLSGAALLALARMWVVVLSAIVGAVLFGAGIGAGLGWMVVFCLGGVAAQYGLARALGEALPGPWSQEGRGTKSPSVAPGVESQPGFTVADPGPSPAIQDAGVEPAQGGARVAPGPPFAPEPGPPAAILKGSGTDGEMFRITDGCLIGRGSACDQRLTDRAVSRQHARFRYAQGSWFLQDEGSTTGTFVNGERVVARRLSPGDQIRFGNTTFTFQSGGGYG